MREGMVEERKFHVAIETRPVNSGTWHTNQTKTNKTKHFNTIL